MGVLATPTGLEPATFSVTGRRANHLRYRALVSPSQHVKHFITRVMSTKLITVIFIVSFDNDSIYNIVIAYSSNPVDDNLSLDTFIICFYKSAVIRNV